MEPEAVATDADVTAQPLTELLSRMRRRELSPVTLVNAHIRRIEAVNPALNAVVAERFEAARREAEAAERDYGAGGDVRPLLGVPFTVKEMIELEGMPHTFGSAGRSDRRAQGDATVVARLRAAGAIPLGVTNVPEWGMWFESENPVYGRTSNPWDVRRTAGGSSGGEGAVVGAGGSVFGIGSDIGGSVRMPASFCGVFGHKPTTGMLPLTGHFPVYGAGPDARLAKRAPWVSIGTLTRSAADIGPLLRVMAGRDRVDPNAQPVALHDTDRVQWRGRRVLLLPDPAIARAGRASPGHVAAVERVGELLAERGAAVEHVPRRIFEHAGDAWFAALQSVGGPSFSDLLAAGKSFSLELEVLRTLIGVGRYSWPALFFCIGERLGRSSEEGLRVALRETRRFVRAYEDLVGTDGVLVTPTHPRIAPRHRGAVLHPFDFLYTAVFNVLRVPVTTVPAGFERGMPLGVQVAGARGCDHLTIAAAAVAEAGFGPWRPGRAAGAIAGGAPR